MNFHEKRWKKSSDFKYLIKNFLKVIIRNNDIELVGNIIQSIAETFEITEIQTTAHFPQEITKLNDIIEKVFKNTLL